MFCGNEDWGDFYVCDDFSSANCLYSAVCRSFSSGLASCWASGCAQQIASCYSYQAWVCVPSQLGYIRHLSWPVGDKPHVEQGQQCESSLVKQKHTGQGE